MGDALIVGRGGSSSGSSGKTLVTKIIQASQSWAVPKAKDQKFYVRIFGGGGGGGYGDNGGQFTTGGYISGGAGGGGGNMNNGELTLEAGTSIPITIGLGGKGGNSSNTIGNGGGITSFGTYLAANGGYGGSGGTHHRGGSGGAGGGELSGGEGYQFGGGGAGFGRVGGNGGKWGGRGATMVTSSTSQKRYSGCLYYENGKVKEYDNGAPILSELNSINTIGSVDVPNGSEDKPYYELNLQGDGLNGTSSNAKTYNSEGGYGGSGGNYCGGGGGYGGNGGNGAKEYNGVGGGGGGYGADGGDGVLISLKYSSTIAQITSGGGGGGYGPSGKGGSQETGFPDGGIAAGGAGGFTNKLDSSSLYSSLDFDALPVGRGGNGICIIQYYA